MNQAGKIERIKGMPSSAYTGRFHVVNDKTGLSVQSEHCQEAADAVVVSFHEHEARCADRRAKDPSIQRREVESYHVEVEK